MHTQKCWTTMIKKKEGKKLMALLIYRIIQPNGIFDIATNPFSDKLHNMR